MGIGSHLLEAYGEHVAKIKLSAIEELADRPKAKYVVVSAVTPTPLGEGKTTTTVGLGQALCGIGRQATVAIRQPSMGPTFGIKGGAAGGGYSQVVPMEMLNLHLTGDFHAVTAAHNLLSAVLDNHLYQGNASGLDPHDITWRRVLDVNDRALRNVIVGLGSKMDGDPAADRLRHHRGVARSWRSSRCPARCAEMRERLGRIVVGYTKDGTPVTAEDIGGAGAMAVHHARRAQAEPHADAGEHAGPRARRPVRQHRARQLVGRRRPHRHPRRRLPRHRGRVRRRHGRRAVLQHQVPGVGADARTPRWSSPRCGRSRRTRASTRSSPAGRCREALLAENPDEVHVGGANLRKQIENIRLHGVSPVVAINAFPGDHPSEHAAIAEIAERDGRAGRRCARTSPTAGAGAAELAEAVAEAADEPSDFRLLYPDSASLRGEDRDGRDEGLRRRRRRLRPRRVPPARRPTSATASATCRSASPRPTCRSRPTPSLKGAPTGWRLPVREVRASVGAGFIYPICGDMRTMPGLGATPAAHLIDIDEDGNIVNLS